MTVTSAAGLSAGMRVTGTWIPTGTTIQSISGTTITLSISDNPNYFDTPTTKTVSYYAFYGSYRLYTNDTSGIASGNIVTATSGVYSNTVVQYVSTNSFVTLNKGLNLARGTSFSATFYTPRIFTQQSYTFAASDRYVVRPDASLPFGSFPGVGTIKP
jgi:hypothetical protein